MYSQNPWKKIAEQSNNEIIDERVPPIKPIRIPTAESVPIEEISTFECCSRVFHSSKTLIFHRKHNKECPYNTKMEEQSSKRMRLDKIRCALCDIYFEKDSFDEHVLSTHF
jgi:hypothetical protein